MMSCGGLSKLKQATAAVQHLSSAVKHQAEAKLNITFQKFEVISFKSQVVAGTNYFVKVHIGDGCAHIRIYQPLPNTGQPAQLTGILLKKTFEDDVEYFEPNLS